mgnify:CR=1 FL=1
MGLKENKQTDKRAKKERKLKERKLKKENKRRGRGLNSRQMYNEAKAESTS